MPGGASHATREGPPASGRCQEVALKALARTLFSGRAVLPEMEGRRSVKGFSIRLHLSPPFMQGCGQSGSFQTRQGTVKAVHAPRRVGVTACLSKGRISRPPRRTATQSYRQGWWLRDSRESMSKSQCRKAQGRWRSAGTVHQLPQKRRLHAAPPGPPRWPRNSSTHAHAVGAAKFAFCPSAACLLLQSWRMPPRLPLDRRRLAWAHDAPSPWRRRGVAPADGAAAFLPVSLSILARCQHRLG